MCFTRHTRKKNKGNKKKSKKARVYPEIEIVREDSIFCHGCKKYVGLDQMKINCAGCDRFFHCCIAGKCIGEKCRNQKTILGEIHQLSWCIYCVPGIPQNKVGGNDCICDDCYQSSN